MKSLKKIIAAISILTITTIAIFAADLKNEDSKTYEVKIHEGSFTKTTSIKPNERITKICSKCEVEVVGVGKISVSGDDEVVIKNGKLAKK